MRKLKRLLASFVTLLILLSIVPMQAHAEWRNDSTGWRYSEDSSLATGWKSIDSNWYYFYSDGYMAHDTTIDGYYVNSSGAWTNTNEGWKSDSTGWWYTEGSSWVTDWKNIDGNWYYFYSNGYMAHDTMIDGYYVNSSGVWSNTKNNNNTTNNQGQTANASTSTKTNAGVKKILIAYISQTGTTEKAAKRIQELTKGDIVQIKTVTPYPDSYQELTEVAKKEKDENARPKLSTRVENMDDYDVIFVGYPIWYHTAPMAIDTFLESYNLLGKTVVPFCTSVSSDIGESMGAINNLCAKANVLEGLTANNLDDIEPWLKKISIIK